MAMKPISRVVPGSTISVKYGKRENKYIRNFTIKECFNMFKNEHSNFNYGLPLFSQAIPKNIVSATERDVIQNVCVIHSNVHRQIKALNIFINKNKLDKNLLLPTSTFELICKLICSNSEYFTNSDVTTWSISRCDGSCPNCGVENFSKIINILCWRR